MFLHCTILSFSPKRPLPGMASVCTSEFAQEVDAAGARPRLATWGFATDMPRSSRRWGWRVPGCYWHVGGWEYELEGKLRARVGLGIPSMPAQRSFASFDAGLGNPGKACGQRSASFETGSWDTLAGAPEGKEDECPREMQCFPDVGEWGEARRWRDALIGCGTET